MMLSILIGPLLVLFVQAIGPWKQPLYGGLSGLLAVYAMHVWMLNAVKRVPADVP